MEQLTSLIVDSDIVYVGGGDTLLMLEYWRQSSLSETLKSANTQGKVLCGSSAGAMCWFEHGVSNAAMAAGARSDAPLLEYLGLLPGVLCPHYQRDGREERFRRVLGQRPGIGIGDCAALAFVGDRFEVVCSKEQAYAHKVYWRNGGIRKTRYANGYRGFVRELTGA